MIHPWAASDAALSPGGRQPKAPTGLNWSHPYALGLRALVSYMGATLWDAVSEQAVDTRVQYGTLPLRAMPTPYGLGLLEPSSGSSAQLVPRTLAYTNNTTITFAAFYVAQGSITHANRMILACNRVDAGAATGSAMASVALYWHNPSGERKIGARLAFDGEEIEFAGVSDGYHVAAVQSARGHPTRLWLDGELVAQASTNAANAYLVQSIAPSTYENPTFSSAGVGYVLCKGMWCDRSAAPPDLAAGAFFSSRPWELLREEESVPYAALLAQASSALVEFSHAASGGWSFTPTTSAAQASADYTHWPQGGLQWGGNQVPPLSADYSSVYQHAASGGWSLGGAALSAVLSSYSHSASGALVYQGTGASWSGSYFAHVAAGGWQWSGHASTDRSTHYLHQPQGGWALSGAAAVARTLQYSHLAQGGVGWGGSASTQLITGAGVGVRLDLNEPLTLETVQMDVDVNTPTQTEQLWAEIELLSSELDALEAAQLLRWGQGYYRYDAPSTLAPVSLPANLTPDQQRAQVARWLQQLQGLKNQRLVSTLEGTWRLYH